MELRKDLSFREMMQLSHDLEEMQETSDMLVALSIIEKKGLKTIHQQ
ncbi:MAG: hypothetical protein KKG04_08735 [Candidatus Thermoplasmatota archaeon]|nr:hypothetical protein [Candidatus Thermoplasmatota archaeon]